MTLSSRPLEPYPVSKTQMITEIVRIMKSQHTIASRRGMSGEQSCKRLRVLNAVVDCLKAIPETTDPAPDSEAA